jgi:hypothetical protein
MRKLIMLLLVAGAVTLWAAPSAEVRTWRARGYGRGWYGRAWRGPGVAYRRPYYRGYSYRPYRVVRPWSYSGPVYTYRAPVYRYYYVP